MKYDDTKQPPHWHVEYDDGDEEGELRKIDAYPLFFAV